MTLSAARRGDGAFDELLQKGGFAAAATVSAVVHYHLSDWKFRFAFGAEGNCRGHRFSKGIQSASSAVEKFSDGKDQTYTEQQSHHAKPRPGNPLPREVHANVQQNRDDRQTDNEQCDVRGESEPRGAARAGEFTADQLEVAAPRQRKLMMAGGTFHGRAQA